MKKNHKTLYMILAVLLISFLFFGSRKEEVVEGFQEGFGPRGMPMRMLTVLKNGAECRDNQANEGWEKIFTAWGESKTKAETILAAAEDDTCGMTPHEGEQIAEAILTALGKIEGIASNHEKKGE